MHWNEISLMRANMVGHSIGFETFCCEQFGR